MGVRKATIVIADIIGCAEVSNNMNIVDYDKFLKQFHGVAKRVEKLLFPMEEYTVEEFEHTVRGDETCLIIHSGGDLGTSNNNLDEKQKSFIHKDVKNAILFALSLKLLWLISNYNQQRVKDNLIPRDLGIGINHGPVVFAVHPATGRDRSSEGYSINLTKRVEGASRKGTCSKIFVSKEVKYLAKESDLPLTFDEGDSYELKGITTPPHLHEITNIEDSKFVLESPVMKELAKLPKKDLERYYNTAIINDQEFWLRKLVGYLLLARNDDRALKLLKKEDFIKNLFEQGVAKHHLKDYEGAIDCYKKILDKDSTVHEAWYNMGIAYGEKKDYDEAIKCCKKAVKIKPDKHEAWHNMGIAYAKKKDYDEAIKCYKKAVKIKPDYYSAWFNLACTYSLKRDTTQAIKHLKKAIELNPKYKEDAKTDKDFDNIRSNEEFKKLVESKKIRRKKGEGE